MRRGWRAVLGVAALTAAAVLPTGAVTGGSVAIADEPGGSCQVSDVGRFTDCESGYYSWNIRQANGGIIGTVDIAFTISERVSPTSRNWVAQWTVYPMNLTGVAEASPTTMAVVPECGGSCSAGAGLADNGAALVRNRAVTGEIPFGSPGAGRDLSSQTINIYLFNPAAEAAGNTYGDPRTELGPVRCDDGVPGENEPTPPVPGCVLETHVPTFVLNSPEFPSPAAPLHAAFVARAQNDPRTQGFGRPGSGRPLIREYLPTKPERDAKRDLVCGNFARYPSPRGTPPPDRDSCDEYPYSASRQGVPLFSVTDHVVARDNNNAGGQLSDFFRDYHINDGDEFYVQP